MKTLFLVSLMLLTACALRPRYQDFVTKSSTEKEMALNIVDNAGANIVGAKVEMTDGKNRFSQVSDSTGVIRIPVDKKYLDENPVMVVTLPSNVTEYRLKPWVAPVVVNPVVIESPVTTLVPVSTDAAIVVQDAGTP